jgi:hypothetical protein
LSAAPCKPGPDNGTATSAGDCGRGRRTECSCGKGHVSPTEAASRPPARATPTHPGRRHERPGSYKRQGMSTGPGAPIRNIAKLALMCFSPLAKRDKTRAFRSASAAGTTHSALCPVTSAIRSKSTLRGSGRNPRSGRPSTARARQPGTVRRRSRSQSQGHLPRRVDQERGE